MNNFNNLLTKTESLRTIQGGEGLENSEVGGNDLLDTYKLYITEISSRKNCKISLKKRRTRSPQTTPKSTHSLFTLKHYPFPSFTCCTLKIQFGNSQERFDNLTYPAIVNVERKSFSVC